MRWEFPALGPFQAALTLEWGSEPMDDLACGALLPHFSLRTLSIIAGSQRQHILHSWSTSAYRTLSEITDYRI